MRGGHSRRFNCTFNIKAFILTHADLCPPGHSIQCVAPALLYVPFSHSTGPTAGLGHLEPAGHSEQLVAFSTTENDPFEHS